MRLVNTEHFELLRCFLWAGGHPVGAIGYSCVHKHNSREIFGSVPLDISGDILNALRPSDKNRMPHAESLQQFMQILRANFRCITARCLRRGAFRTRIECDYPICFCESLNLATPGVSACAPA